MIKNIDLNKYEKITTKKLGITYTKDYTIFRVWSPLRDRIQLSLYDSYQAIRSEIYEMKKDEDGCFECQIKGDLDGKFYTFRIDDKEVTDPYSVGASINSRKSAIIDLEKTNPKGFKSHKIKRTKREDAIIYEMSIKDFTSSLTSNTRYRGKYLSLVEEGSKYKGLSTGLDHLVDLGVSHVHFMPIYDFISVDEDSNLDFNEDNYNWGYDPELYNVCEGQYSINPRDPKSRIYELKLMIQALHEKGISVIMDVVFNHTYKSKNSNFNVIFPDYYYRQVNGDFSNGSGCGNELATERPMVRKFIIDSLKYWQDEYKIDGFRFDLMALIDIDTVNLAIKELEKTNPDILIYGEPWMALDTPLRFDKRIYFGSQNHSDFSLFNSNFRDAIKGDNDGYSYGFVQGDYSFKNDIERGIVGSVDYDDIRRGTLDKSIESINYFNSHDNLILNDKLKASLNYESKEDIKDYTKMSFAIIMFSQGIPFFHAGNEFMRSKKFFQNTYNLPLKVNEIDWNLKKENYDIYSYVRDLIRFRKDHKEFRLVDKDKIRENLHFIDGTSFGHVLYKIKNDKGFLLVSHNADKKDIYMERDRILAGNINYEKIKLIFDGKGYNDIEIDGELKFTSLSTEVYQVYEKEDI